MSQCSIALIDTMRTHGVGRGARFTIDTAQAQS
jgi:hypothetical protein